MALRDVPGRLRTAELCAVVAVQAGGADAWGEAARTKHGLKRSCMARVKTTKKTVPTSEVQQVVEDILSRS